MDNKVKILICGDVEGKFNILFHKINVTNTKAGPFNALLCVGNFFGNHNSEFAAYRNGVKKVPIPTYILGPNSEDQLAFYPDDESELCENVYYLGKRGLYTITEGLTFAYLSGTRGSGSSSSNNKFNYSTDDVIALRDICCRSTGTFRGVDILLTSEWPQGISSNEVELQNDEIAAQPAWLACQLKPRYHVSGLQGIFFERPPYRNVRDSNEVFPNTRFIALAKVGNAKKAKWLYALHLTPLNRLKDTDFVQKSTDETECPYDFNALDMLVNNRKQPHRRKEQHQFFYDMESQGEGMKRKVKRPRIEFDQSKCWFCLASPCVEKHLVLTVGENVYVALAKGGLVDEHFLICPVEHNQCSLKLRDEVRAEIEQFKSSIERFYARKAHVAVFFERNYKTLHMQMQAVPVPKSLANSLKRVFQDKAQANGYDLSELEADQGLEHVVEGNSPFFIVYLPNGEALFTKIHLKRGFPINFAREVLASTSILDMPQRSEWKDCVQSKDEESALILKLRTDFEPFNIKD